MASWRALSQFRGAAFGGACACAASFNFVRPPCSERLDGVGRDLRPTTRPLRGVVQCDGKSVGAGLLPQTTNDVTYYDYGVVIANLGTPEAATAPAVKKFLAEFLHDYRVVDLSRWKWCPILHGVILRKRPPKIAELYSSIWTENGSPLMDISVRQRDALKVELEKRLGSPVKVMLAMRYGDPTMQSALNEMESDGVRKVVVLPMYPQYSSATTGSTFDSVADAMRNMRGMPDLRFVHEYHLDPEYIEALAGSVRKYWEKHGRPDKLLFSFHGIPVRYIGMGDYYHEQCEETAEAVAKLLGLDDQAWQLSFQSQFGKEEWLGPATDKTVEGLGEAGLGRLDVICPGFAADCLETLEEIAGENKKGFLEAGGKEFNYIPALNYGADHISAIASIVQRRMSP